MNYRVGRQITSCTNTRQSSIGNPDRTWCQRGRREDRHHRVIGAERARRRVVIAAKQVPRERERPKRDEHDHDDPQRRRVDARARLGPAERPGTTLSALHFRWRGVGRRADRQ